MIETNVKKGIKGFVEVDLATRFWARVDKRGKDECWEWTGSKTFGYGIIWINRRNKRATQVSWELEHKKKWPSPLHAMHTCDNPPCVNPHHIKPGTPKENMQDSVRKGRFRPVKKMKCRRGHPYDESNTYVTKSLTRVCRKCHRASVKQFRKKRKLIGLMYKEKEPPKTHCSRGHEFNESNTKIVTVSGGGTRRGCRLCKQYTQRLRRAAKKALASGWDGGK